MKKIFIGADHTIDYKGVKGNGVTVLNNGVCTWSLKGPSPALTEIATGIVPYVAASSGDYQGVIERATTSLLSADQVYFLDITFNHAATGYDDFRRVRLMASRRSEEE